jgi:hypothetical protein
MTDRKEHQEREALSRRRVAIGFIAVVVIAAVPRMLRAEVETYNYHRRRSHRRRRRCAYHSRRC